MIETPQDGLYLPLPSQTTSFEGPDAPLLSESEKMEMKMPDVQPNPPLVKRAPITSTILGSIRHLRTRGGRFAKFRGFHVQLLSHLVAFHIAVIIESILPLAPLPARYVAHFLAIVAIAPLMMTWTHVVISEPSSKAWFRRIPSLRAWRKVLPATALFAFAEQFTIALPTALFAIPLLNLDDVEFENETDLAKAIAAKWIAMLATATYTFVRVWIPASMMLTRVQASLLPESDETIVPVDRSFQGKLVPEVVGGSGKLGILDARRIFDLATYHRLVKLYAKLVVIQTVWIVLYFVVVFVEVNVMFPDVICDVQKVFQAYMRGELKLSDMGISLQHDLIYRG